MTINLKEFYNKTLERILEVAEYQKAMCGKVKKLDDKQSTCVDNTPIHSAFSYMDMFTQDYLMIPIFKEFPNLVPLVEESTGMKLKYQDNKSEDVLIMDPLDGTYFYCKGEKDYSIMVGLLNKGEMVVGIICYPETKEVYAAIKNQGAWKINSSGIQKQLPRLNSYIKNDKEIAAHYRFLKHPFEVLSDKLKQKEYNIASNFTDFGSSLTGGLRVALGKSCAFIGSHMSIHDFAATGLIVEELGGVVRLFDYNGKNDDQNWIKTDNRYKGLDPKKPNPRFRVIIADNDSTVDKIIGDMYK